MNDRMDSGRRLYALALAGTALALAVLGWVTFGPASPPVMAGPSVSASPSVEERSLKGEALVREMEALRKEQRELRARLTALRPRSAYIVVDRANNRIYLRSGDSVEVDAPASTGSGAILRERGGQARSWVFDTPTGRFSILAKRPDPVWTKPDWAFLEEGKPIPTRLSKRREYGSLGEYALDLGDGYMIHGTLYERLLGRSVTHGCVRVGRDALRVMVARTGPGTQVFIY